MVLDIQFPAETLHKGKWFLLLNGKFGGEEEGYFDYWEKELFSWIFLFRMCITCFFDFAGLG